jgi:predicted CopG family antitoxin
MATKNISISEDAYRRLASLKLPNESFSVVINRLTGKHSLNDLFGVLSRNEANRLAKNIERVRNERARADRNRSSRLKEAFK